VGIKDKLANISSGSIMIVEFPAKENQIKLIVEFLNFKKKSSSYGIYVSSNRPSKNLIEKVKEYEYDLKNDIEKGRIWIIDLISKNVGDSELNNIIYISSLELSAMQMAIEKALAWLKGKDKQGWILFDSIATLLLYNSPDSLLKHLHFVFGKLRVLGIDAIIFTINEGVDKKVISMIRQLCDTIITV